jgi:hypothetical protein
MKKKKRSTLISKPDSMKCWACEGTGLVSEPSACCSIGMIICPTCNGSGIWIENHYIIIDEENRIAFDSDTGG